MAARWLILVLAIPLLGVADELQARPFSLPPLASCEEHEQADGEPGWRWSGELRGNLQIAVADLALALERDRWVLQHATHMRNRQQRLLQTWQRGDSSLLILFRDARPGRTHFMAGSTDAAKPNPSSNQSKEPTS